MTPLVLVGGGGHAKVVAGVVARQRDRFTTIGYTDSANHGPLLTLQHLGTDEALPALALRHPGLCAAITVGFVRHPSPRRGIGERLRQLGIAMPAIVSTEALVEAGVSLGDGTQVLDRVVVNPGATVGAGAILNTACVIEHDVHVGDYSHVAPGAVVSGGAVIGADVLVGANATVIQGVSICDFCIIGAGAVVTRSLERAGTYVGAPARRAH
jgi:sugar O-acyltransferase (sialic acid O-acetyltransferase NeuD family)